MERNNYKTVKLGDVATFKYGSYIKSQDTSVKGKFPVYSGYRIAGYLNDYIYKEPQLLVVARGVGGTGDVKISPPKCTITNLSIVIHLNPNKVEKEYLFYKFRNHNLRYLDSGSAQSQITIQDLSNLELSLPPLPEQKRISSILSSFDNKIELLRKENHTLEDIAQSIFKEWFVKYNFPNKDGKPYKDNNGKMIDSELGLIPEGWRVGNLGEACELKSGYAFKGNDFVNKSDIKILKIKDLQGNGNIDLTNLSSVNNGSIKNRIVQKFLLSEGDILIAMSGNTTGKIGIMPNTKNKVYLNQRVGKLFFKDLNYYSYTYNFLMANNYEKKILNMGYGSAQPNINPQQINNIKVSQPPENLLRNYNNKAKFIIDKQLKNLELSINLKLIRDFLINKLIK